VLGLRSGAVVTVVADAGAHVGMGHLARCSAVAAALGERGVQVRCLGWGANGEREVDGVRWRPLDDPADRGSPGELLLIDSYAPERDELAGGDAPLAAFHDGGEPPPGVALVIGAGEAPPGVARLTGLEHACLRRPYWRSAQREPAAEVGEVLVTTGAGARGAPFAAVDVAAAVARALPGVSVHVTGGDAAPGVEAIGTPPSLDGHLEAADLAVTAAGQTMLEALATGRPVVAAVTAENQRLQAAQAAEVAEIVEGARPEKLADAAAALAGDADRRSSLGRRAGEAVDGCGAHRVADALLAVAAARPPYNR